MQLYKIAEDYQSALDSIYDQETGEIKQEMLCVVDEFKMDVREKGIATASYIKNMDAYSDAISNEIERLQKRKKTMEARNNYLRDYLKYNMEKCNISEISCPQFSIKIKKTPPSVNVIDDDAIPSEFRKRKEVISLDKAGMLSEMKNGKQIPGVELKQSTRIEIK